MPKTLIEQVRKHNEALRKAHANKCCTACCPFCIANRDFQALSLQLLIKRMRTKEKQTH